MAKEEPDKVRLSTLVDRKDRALCKALANSIGGTTGDVVSYLLRSAAKDAFHPITVKNILRSYEGVDTDIDSVHEFLDPKKPSW